MRIAAIASLWPVGSHAPADAMNHYSLLSIGDGLVSQIPALLLSVVWLVALGQAVDVRHSQELLVYSSCHDYTLPSRFSGTLAESRARRASTRGK